MSTVTGKGIDKRFRPNRLSRLVWDGLFIGLIALLFVGSSFLVYTTGGTKYAWPYLVLIPALIAAARFGVVGGIAGGLAGGLLLGPFMPLDVAADIPQRTENWLIRLAFFTGLGTFTGVLFLLKNRESRLRENDARMDPDTGLPNSVALMEALEEHRTAAAGRSPFLLLIRVRDLADIIEIAGTAAAGDLMSELALRLRSQIGDPVQVYRFSASQLMVVAWAPTQDFAHIPARAADCAVDPVEARGIPVHAELVMGSAGGGASDLEPRELIRQANMAVAAAAERHQMHLHFSPAFEQNSVRSVELLAGVRRGLRAKEFELFYQPKIRARDGRSDGCEGLIRWRSPDGELIPPGQFMPRVERSALIDPLTRYVVATACEFGRDPRARPVSINFTVRNLLDRDLAETLVRAAADNGLPAGSVEIEITEGAVVRDPAAARRSIEQLRNSGFLVTLDDFGTGYSSFEHLRLLPLTGLKIDRTFVKALDDDRRAQELMTCMVQVGHALGLKVVAEGVESQEQGEFLKGIDCDLLQGFHFARPMPAESYRTWLDENS